MWSGAIADIPANWSFCNGSNGTPDLRDLFIVGAKQDDAGVAKSNITGSLQQTGGSVSHTHTTTAGATWAITKAINIEATQAIQKFYALAYVMHNPGV